MILTVLNIATNDAAQGEQLLEFCFAQNHRQQLEGHILICNDPGVDKEMLARIRISAELAFTSVYSYETKPLSDPVAPKWKACSNSFQQVAKHIRKEYNCAWLWLEPDSVPTKQGWVKTLLHNYESQPKDYMGTRMKMVIKDKPEIFFMGRVAVYPNGAVSDMPVADAPFEISSGSNVLPKMTNSKLFQQVFITNESDLAKVRDDALIVHGDKNGFLLRKLEARLAPHPIVIPVIEESIPLPSPVVITVEKKRGRPSKAEIAARVQAVTAQMRA